MEDNLIKSGEGIDENDEVYDDLKEEDEDEKDVLSSDAEENKGGAQLIRDGKKGFN